MTGRRYRVGIAGYGVVGQRRRHFIDRHPQFETVAICDRTLESAGTDPDGVRRHLHYESLLGENLDALFVCLTNDIAAEVTIAGLNRGLHVFCEKPPGRDLTDIAGVVACERRHPGLKLKYGFNHRYHDSVRDALAIIDGGTLGRVVNLRGVYGKSQFVSFAEQSDWRVKRAIAGGGILLDQGIHMVHLMMLFGGRFDDVVSFVSNGYWRHDVEDNAYALLRGPTGIVAMLHSTATQWRHRFELEVTLERGALILSGILSGSRSYGAETLTIVWAGEGDVGDPREQTNRYNRDNSWRDEIADFADDIRLDRPVTIGNSDEALRTMQLVYRIYCGDQRWRERWDLSDQIPPLEG